jgi:hypothetical protein
LCPGFQPETQREIIDLHIATNDQRIEGVSKTPWLALLARKFSELVYSAP